MESTDSIRDFFPSTSTPASRGEVVTVNMKVRASKALMNDMIRRYAIVLTTFFRPKSRNRRDAAKERSEAFEKAKEEIRNHIVMDPENPGCPLLVKHNCEWKPGKYNPDNGRVRAVLWIGGVKIIAVPAVSVGVEYLYLDEDDRWVSNGDFLSFVMTPFKTVSEDSDEPDPYHIFWWVRLDSRKALEAVQGLYGDDDDERTAYEPLSNNPIDKIGARKWEFRATTCHPSKINPKKMMVVGHHMGKIVITMEDSYNPTAGTEDGTFETDVWRYEEGPTMILVSWLGKRGTNVTVDDKVTTLDVSFAIEGFKTLGKQPHELTVNMVGARVAEIMDMALDEDNPALAAVVEIGLTDWDDEYASQYDFVVDALKIAAEKVKEELMSVWRKLVDRFTDWNKLSTIFGTRDLGALENATEGEDALTELITERLKAQFSWDIPILRELRVHVVKGVAAYRAVPKAAPKPDAQAAATPIAEATAPADPTTTPNPAAAEPTPPAAAATAPLKVKPKLNLKARRPETPTFRQKVQLGKELKEVAVSGTALYDLFEVPGKAWSANLALKAIDVSSMAEAEEQAAKLLSEAFSGHVFPEDRAKSFARGAKKALIAACQKAMTVPVVKTDT